MYQRASGRDIDDDTIIHERESAIRRGATGRNGFLDSELAFAQVGAAYAGGDTQLSPSSTADSESDVKGEMLLLSSVRVSSQV